MSSILHFIIISILVVVVVVFLSAGLQEAAWIPCLDFFCSFSVCCLFVRLDFKEVQAPSHARHAFEFQLPVRPILYMKIHSHFEDSCSDRVS